MKQNADVLKRSKSGLIGRQISATKKRRRFVKIRQRQVWRSLSVVLFKSLDRTCCQSWSAFGLTVDLLSPRHRQRISSTKHRENSMAIKKLGAVTIIFLLTAKPHRKLRT